MPKEQRARSPASHGTGPYNASSSSAPIPKSVELQYRKKCIDLKKRIRDLEQSNDKLVKEIEAKKKSVERTRLTRAILTDLLEESTGRRADSPEATPSPPPTPPPRERAVRTVKKAKATAAEGTPSALGGTSPARGTSPASPGPLSSYTSTFNSKDGNPVEKGKRASMGNSGVKKKTPPKSRPKNAYLLFVEDESRKMRARLPKGHKFYRARSSSSPPPSREQSPYNIDEDAEFDINKELALAWCNLGQEGQKKYIERYEQMLKAEGGKKEKAEDKSVKDEGEDNGEEMEEEE